MKLQSCFMIRFIALNNIDMQELFSKLESDIKKHFPHTALVLVSNEQYWKYPECNDVVYNVSNYGFIKVVDFIKHFLLSWVYKDGYAYSIDLNRKIDIEDAIWSQNCHPEEVFLIPGVSWAHIYTWEED